MNFQSFQSNLCYDFRRALEPMAAVNAPFLAAGFAGLIGKLDELVLAANKPETNDARTHIGCHDQFD